MLRNAQTATGIIRPAKKKAKHGEKEEAAEETEKDKEKGGINGNGTHAAKA